MCGIIAVVGTYRYSETPESLLERGPDQHGEYVDSDVQLIQTRLQITGKDRMTLPLIHKDYILLFNGEIFNYRELNLELTEYDFIYDSDFETILYGFIKYGSEFINRLDGQYAIFIWDKLNKKSHIFIDPFKIQSLYKCRYQDSIIYSSNLRSLPFIGFDQINNTGYGNISCAQLL